ncbi:putative NADH dehydrogenase/NAD(P)H nitroreductase [Marinilactibacillus psychrotolerans 42ea]|uniref:Putative NADH dehydrogenase/NAD(P)H nitroreductase n=1 Tax=Marinilactibacillus psychrotolerans 42ea TaxID=1255609 RepID=A0A1R4K0U8_9LACT|nr:nitroreductase family protein [Marinilactibacillus psychrotolerans]SJN37906.1 putative NADH dehydrogenase/NAD(P)H nitroreductase [Marinilactibacillus psychrotolerans 42ea]
MNREKLEILLPVLIINFIKRSIYKFRLLNYFMYDYRQYSKHSFGFTRKPTYENLRAKITLHYHSIEKGLSNINVRLGFGEKALKNLVHVLEEYKNCEFPKDDKRYLSAINILISYVDLHEKNNYDVPWIKGKLTEQLNYLGENQTKKMTKNHMPYREFTKKEIIESVNKPFDEFLKHRVSVRDYSTEEVDVNQINDAIEMAIRTPSVCNRQPWKVYVLKNYDTIQKASGVQKGLNGERRTNVRNLLIVTTDISYFANDKERNEPFIDGGLFSMTLLYALHYKGLAACSLNNSMSNKDFKEVKRIVNIRSSERLIMFISVGKYSDKLIVPTSTRDSLDDFVEYR